MIQFTELGEMQILKSFSNFLLLWRSINTEYLISCTYEANRILNKKLPA